MTRRTTFRQIGAAFTAFGSAIAVAAAVEAGRRPRARDLANLGIAPNAFDNIGGLT